MTRRDYVHWVKMPGVAYSVCGLMARGGRKTHNKAEVTCPKCLEVIERDYTPGTDNIQRKRW